MGKAGEGEPSLLTFPIGPQAPPHSFLWWVVPPLAWPALPKISWHTMATVPQLFWAL